MMKHSFYLLFALLLMTACKPKVPSQYIQPDDMERILYDYYVAEAMGMTKQDQNIQNIDFERTKYFHAVLKKHKVTQADFDSSLVYYYSHLPRLKDIYTHVNERLSDEAKMIGASVAEIGRYSRYSASGDTANIWKQSTDLMLMPRPTMNRMDFTIEVDSSFHLGDSFMLQFMSEYIYQNGSKDAVVCVVTKYEGDSILQTVNHVSVSGISQIRIPACSDKKLKEMNGFIYLGTGGDASDNTRKIMFISQLQLIRFHNKQIKNETKSGDDKKDSLQRTDDNGGLQADTLRRGIGRRLRDKPLPLER